MSTERTSEIIARICASQVADVFTSIVCTVAAYDPSTGTADLRPVMRRQMRTEAGETKTETLPIIPHIPVFHLGSGGGLISLPIEVGSAGLLACLYGSTDPWFESGEAPADPQDPRTHHISNGIFFPGVRPQNATPAQLADPALVIEHPTSIKLGANATDFASLASRVDAEISRLDGRITALAGIVQGGSGVPAPVPVSGSTVASSRVKVAT